ncbi:hypothetical protein TanjilG_19605 [Lupinus angustifolius]|uniref:Purple acid phosphatase n=2 Tax=Lupinus angustifolius TaxID=3871 RepID=A0A1J7IB42_LUPAN|nr:hypothetical protein TanjilG_19605 [Lupinus angustifolius]
MGVLMRVRGIISLLFLISVLLEFNVVYSYTRPPPRNNIFTPLSHDDGASSPQQVRVSQVGKDRMRISWFTIYPTPATVQYGLTPSADSFNATGVVDSYRYMLYYSGPVHNVIIGPLNPNTVYYYRMGKSPKVYTLKTPPSQFPIKFAVVGDLGQTEYTKTTLEHILTPGYDMLLLAGDLSYADTIQEQWETFGRFIEPLASQRPWMVTTGDHDVEKITLFHRRSFTAYNTRWLMPFDLSGSKSNQYYSFEVAGVHIIMLGSYTDFDSKSNQYKWLQGDLNNVDRKKTPWLVVMFHAPWYNSNTLHQGEYASVEMKAVLEDMLYKAHVDLVIAAHIHAYERFTRVYKEKANKCGPVYITIGDGGNRDHFNPYFMDPPPEISFFRERSFGHGTLEVTNATHALWTWIRNHDDKPVISESLWLTSLSSDSACNGN